MFKRLICKLFGHDLPGGTRLIYALGRLPMIDFGPITFGMPENTSVKIERKCARCGEVL